MKIYVSPGDGDRRLALKRRQKIQRDLQRHIEENLRHQEEITEKRRERMRAINTRRTYVNVGGPNIVLNPRLAEFVRRAKARHCPEYREALKRDWQECEEPEDREELECRFRGCEEFFVEWEHEEQELRELNAALEEILTPLCDIDEMQLREDIDDLGSKFEKELPELIERIAADLKASGD